MKRWIIVLLIALALILLLSPGIVGRLAEKSVDENLAWVDDENDDVVIESERFDRGWFSSEGRHRVSLREGAASSLLGFSVDPTGGQAVALIIDTHFDHGLVPVTSMGREEGTLLPSLASTVSTLQIDRGDGELVDLPGTVYSVIGLGGESTFRYLMESGEQVAGNTSTAWSGADLTIAASPDHRVLSLVGSVLPLSVETYGVTTRVGGLNVDLEQDRSRYRFGIGSLELDVDSVSVHSSGTQDSGFSRLELKTDSELEDNRVSGNGTLKLTELFVPNAGTFDVSADIELDDIDAGALVAIGTALRNSNRGGYAPGLEAALPSIASQLEMLAARGGHFAINSFDVRLPQGNWQSSLSLEWPASDPDEPFVLPSFLLRLDASADLRVSRAVYNDIVQAMPDANYLLAAGFLQASGDELTMTANFSGGLLTVNGAPMPIPLGQ